MESLGIYVSIPFCKAKCSFCNFASGVFAEKRMESYVDRIVAEIREAGQFTERLGVTLPRKVDSIYLGGGTPSLLPPALVQRLFAGLRSEFDVTPNAEITVECAPGQLSDQTLEALQGEGMNRLSFGVQSFVDKECAAVGRLHTGAQARDELRRVSSAGVRRVGVDLIAGLPHQTEASWRWTVEQAIATDVEHVSVYMLEVDEDSRLGRESLAGGKRYGAGALPMEDRVADWYAAACLWLEVGGIGQYEISNFAREGGQSRHNRKYWERAAYVGFGMDAHSMMRMGAGGVRWANADSMSGYTERLGAWERTVERVEPRAGFEEALFLGLRLLEGISLDSLQQEFHSLVEEIGPPLEELSEAGLVSRAGDRLKLTETGRMVSNEVFERLLLNEINAVTA